VRRAHRLAEHEPNEPAAAESPAPYEPFDLALLRYYAPKRDMKGYRALVELGVRAGDPLAEYAMATWYLHGNAELGVARDAARAVRLLRRSARTFNRAMYDLALCMLDGEGMRKDARGAYRLFRRSAELGTIVAMEAQAWCLVHGVGVRRNARGARRLRIRASRLAAVRERLDR
jgi:hypothetical protein